MIVSDEKRGQIGYMMQPQNYSVNDGEGIRTVLFLAGCPLRCKWCANPESFTVSDKNHLVRAYSVEEVLKNIDKQKIFYRFSGGGITFSGGEPTLQLDFLDTLSEKLYDDGYDLAMETCGYFDYDRVKHVLRRMGLIFVDIKLMDGENHLTYTGKSNLIIHENIRKMGEDLLPVVVRIPVIEGVNATEENIRETAKFVKRHLKSPKMELLPYHTLGDYKYDKLELEKTYLSYERPSDAKMDRLRNIVTEEGVQVVSYL